MKDWLGNTLELGDYVVYASKSSLVGMVLGWIQVIDENRIVIKPVAYSGSRKAERAISLPRYSDAYRAITKYSGEMPGE